MTVGFLVWERARARHKNSFDEEREGYGEEEF
jgi:hypothetical protein